MYKVFLVLILFSLSLFGQEDPKFTKLLMRSTYKLIGKDGRVGTGIILFKPFVPSSDIGVPILVTAKHVFDSIRSDSVLIYLRKFDNETFSQIPYWLIIRDHGKKLYISHPTEDIAVMNVKFLPKFIDNSFVGTEFLATDKMIEEAQISTGTEVSILGYPFGYGYNEGFSILRGGKIASYPILPSIKYKTYLLDFEVFGGNSGGIVYYSFHGWHSKGGTTEPVGYNYIIGLVIEQLIKPKNVNKAEDPNNIDKRVVIGVVLNSTYIIETIKLLPL